MTKTILQNPHKVFPTRFVKSLNRPYNFQNLFNFRLLLTFKLSYFGVILTKIAKLQFLETTFKCIKTGQKWYLYDQATIECRFTLKHVRDMIIIYSQMHCTDKYSQYSSIIRPIWLNGWVFLYELSRCGFESCCYGSLSSRTKVNLKVWFFCPKECFLQKSF